MDFKEYERGLYGDYGDYLQHIQEMVAGGNPIMSPQEWYSGPRKRELGSTELAYLLGLMKMARGTDQRYGEKPATDDDKTMNAVQKADDIIGRSTMGDRGKPSDMLPDFLDGLRQAQRFREYGW